MIERLALLQDALSVIRVNEIQPVAHSPARVITLDRKPGQLLEIGAEVDHRLVVIVRVHVDHSRQLLHQSLEAHFSDAQLLLQIAQPA